MIKAVIFDMDGLMFDTERLYDRYWQEVSAEHSLGITRELIDAMRGVSHAQSVRIFNSEFNAAYDFEKVSHMVTQRVHASLAQHVPLRPGLRELLSELERRCLPMAIASSTKHEQIIKNLTNAKMREYFSVIIGGDMIAGSKPLPDIFLAAAQALGVSPTDCLVLEDSYNGVRAGSAAGCTTVMIPDMDEPTCEMRELSAAVLPSLADVIAFLDKA